MTLPAAREGVADIYRLSPLQEGMLFDSLRAPGSGAYVQQLAMVLEGELEIADLRQAWERVVARHAVLRTSFHWEGLEHPVQVVHQEAELPWRELDWRDTTPEEQRRRFHQLLAEDRRLGFDLESAPLARVALTRLGAGRWWLLWSHHHLVLDGWSLPLVLRDLLLFYGGLPEPPPPHPFRDAIAWLRRAEPVEQEAFWRQQLAGVAAPTPLPLAAAAAGTGTGEILAHTALLSREDTAAVEAAARRLAVTPATLVQGAWALLLARGSGEEDVTFGAVVSGRPAELPGAEEMVGMFINTLPVRVRVPGAQAAGEWVAELQRQLARLRRHEHTALLEIQGWSEVPRGTPLFESVVAFENYPVEAALGSGVAGIRVAEVETFERDPLALSLRAVPGERLELHLAGRAGRYDAASLARLAGWLERLLLGLAQEPARPLGEIPWIDRQERERLLALGAGAEPAGPAPLLLEAVAARAAETPERLAVVGEGGALSYGELLARAERAARRLRRLGVGPEVRVGVLAERAPATVAALLGVLRAGGAYLPLDPRYPRQRLAFMLEDAAPAVVVAGDGLEGVLDGYPWHVVPLVDLVGSGGEGAEEVATGAAVDAGHDPATTPLPEPSPEQLAYLIYTSGSTGRPKGVMVPHGALARFLAAMAEAPGLGADDVLVAVTTLSFDIASLELFLPLTVGARLMVAPAEVAADGERLRRLLEESGATVVQATPAGWRLLLAAGWRGPLGKALCGGEALPPDLAAELRACAGEVWNLYGPTETTVWSTVARVGGEEVTVGRPIAGTRVTVVDAVGEPVPEGVPGELLIGGEGVARGYWQRAPSSAERFLPDPFGGAKGARLYRTGDRARWRSDGDLEILGRLDAQVKVRGFRIEPGEVEVALRSHPAVADAVVVAREDGAEARLVAYLVAAEGSEAGAGELRRHLGERLPPHLVPAAFVPLAELPRTASGKVDRRALPAPGPGRPELEAPYVAPRGELEERLAALWGEVLGVERVGAQDSFFALGGHSLLALRLASRVREDFGVEVPLWRLLEQPTVAGLAAALAEAGDPEREEAAPELPRAVPDPEHRHDPFPLTDVQQAYWVGRSIGFELGGVATHVYLELEVEGLDLGRLEAAWNALVRRHDMLRGVVLPTGEQQILPQVPAYRIEALDLAGAAPEAAEAELAALRQRMSHQVLPADRWPLFELRATRLPGGATRVHVSFDLLIGDARSFEVLQQELRVLYDDPEAALPPLALSFRDYVLAAESLRGGELHRRSLEYWRSRLPELPGPPPLPLAAAPSTLGRPRFVRRSAQLSATAWQELRGHATAAGLTPSGILLAAFSEVLGRWSAATRFTLDLTLFRRLPLHPEVDRLVGDFTAISLLEVDRGAPTFLERARALQGRLWQDLDHAWASGVEVLRELARSGRGAPGALMPVVFTSILDPTTEEEPEAPTELPLGRLVESVSQTPQVWLDHQVYRREGGLGMSWDAVEALFSPGLLDAMFASYRAFLDRLAAGEGWEEAEPLPLPPEQEARHRQANATAAQLPAGLLHEPFAGQAAAHPEQPAVVAAERTLGYGELARRARTLGAELRRRGARPGELVAVALARGWRQAVAVLAVHEAGAAYLPVDPDLPPERFRHLLAHGEVRLALTAGDVADSHWPPGVDVVAVPEEAPAAEVDALPPVCGPEELAYVIYTSGSTGVPKGVMIEHRAALNTILDVNHRFGVGPTDRVLALSSLSFDLSVWDLFGAFAAGATVVVPEPAPGPDPARWAQLLRREGVTVWNSVPALMRLLVEYLEGKGEGLPDSLRLVLLSGDWIPVDLPDRIRALAGGEIEVVSLGGATEASIWSILFPVGEVDPTWRSIPYGRAMANQSFHVLDERLAPCPDGVPGELFIGGAGLARGYWRDEVQTRARFLRHPGTGERLYRTGDLGRWLPDGTIEFLGRRDFQVKIQGYRVEPGEVEAALREHPQVAEAVVVARGPRDGDRRLVAYLVGAGASAPEPGELRAFLAGTLPPYMVPARFVAMPALPLTPNGKVDRQALPEGAGEAVAAPPGGVAPPAAAVGRRTELGAATAGPGADPGMPADAVGAPLAEGGGPPGEAGAAFAAAGAPRSRPAAAVEEPVVSAAAADLAGRIAALAARVVARPVGIEENLLELGASSVDLVRLANALEAELGVRPGVEELYRDATPLGIARACAARGATVSGPVVEPADGATAPARPAARPLVVDPEEREAWKRRQLALRPLAGRPGVVPLEGPVPAALWPAFSRRRSRRRFAPEPVPQAALAALLGQLRRVEHRGASKYRYGSAGGTYPVQLYLHARDGGVTGLAGGTWYYHPVAHALAPLAAGAPFDPSLHDPIVNRPLAERAAFALYLVAEMAAIEPLYGENALRFATLEAGLMTQVLEEAAPEHGIALCQVGTVDFPRLSGLLELAAGQPYLNGLLGGTLAPDEEGEGSPRPEGPHDVEGTQGEDREELLL